MVRKSSEDELSELTNPTYPYKKTESLESISNVFNSNEEDESSETSSSDSSQLILQLEDEGIWSANLPCTLDLNLINPINDVDGGIIYSKCRTNRNGTMTPKYFERVWNGKRQIWYGSCTIQSPRTMLDDLDEDSCFIIGSRNTSICIEGTILKAKTLSKPRRGGIGKSKFVLDIKPQKISDENGKSLFRLSQRGGIDAIEIEEHPITITVKHNMRTIQNLVHQQTTVKILARNATPYEAIKPWGKLIMDEGQVIATIPKTDNKMNY